MVSIDVLLDVIHWLFVELIVGPLKAKMTWRHFSAVIGLIWIKFRRHMQNDMSFAVIWSKSKVEFQYVSVWLKGYSY